MSLVNRMLQDIDRRSAGAATGAGVTFNDVRASVPRQARAARSWMPLALLAVAIAAGAVVATGGLSGLGMAREEAAAAKSLAAAGPTASPRTGVPATSPAPVPGAQREWVASDAPAPLPQGPNGPAIDGAIDSLRLSVHLSAPPAAPRTREVAPVAVQAKPAEVASARTASATAAKVVSPSTVAARPVPASEPAQQAAAAGPKPVLAVRQVAAAETVATARQQWAEGARSGALATVREALAAADASRDAQATRLLALELARFELASQRPQAALEVLSANAARIGDDAEALAMRGNAQQRIGAHAQAAESYLAALRQRPDEGNWMLGAAISLAAEGRTGEAQVLVHRAAARGAVTPQIAAYLQQLGIAALR